MSKLPDPKILSLDPTSVFKQGQARGYGRITHILPLPLVGHHFQRATVTKWLDRFQIQGYQMKDMDTVFPLTPYGLLWVEQFGHSTLSK